MEKKSFQQKLFGFIEDITENRNKIVIPEVLLHILGNLEASILLSKLIYWADKGGSQDGYIFKSFSEWHKETLLSEFLIKKATKQLVRLEILETVKRIARGAPTWHYRLNKEVLIDMFLKYIRIDSSIFQDDPINILETYTLITSKSTNSEKTLEEGESAIPRVPFEAYCSSHQIAHDLSEAIKFFLNAYEIHRGQEHPNLREGQWENISSSFLTVMDGDIDLELEAIKTMIDKYFSIDFNPGCKYLIHHFNNPVIKLNRFYEMVYRA